jgi:DNA-binding NtrC family response regulator
MLIENAKVLVVEDDVDLKVILERILLKIDPALKYEWVTTAEEAAVELRRDHYALVIADFTLEGKGTGIDLWELVQERYPHIPFMMMSALDVEMFFKLVGRNRTCPIFLPKPFYSGECRQVIESLLQS